MSADYTGLHGRSPYEDVSHEEMNHFVPENWEELDRGICPSCGRTVSWDEAMETWVVDPTLVVLVLTEAEVGMVDSGLEWVALRNDKQTADFIMARDQVQRQFDLNRPFEEAAGG